MQRIVAECSRRNRITFTDVREQRAYDLEAQNQVECGGLLPPSDCNPGVKFPASGCDSCGGRFQQGNPRLVKAGAKLPRSTYIAPSCSAYDAVGEVAALLSSAAGK
jgi:hypothetical protein